MDIYWVSKWKKCVNSFSESVGKQGHKNSVNKNENHGKHMEITIQRIGDTWDVQRELFQPGCLVGLWCSPTIMQSEFYTLSHRISSLCETSGWGVWRFLINFRNVFIVSSFMSPAGWFLEWEHVRSWCQLYGGGALIFLLGVIPYHTMILMKREARSWDV